MAHAASVPGGASPGAFALDGVRPIALLAALETLIRTSWSTGRGLLVARVAVAAVAAVAAVVSYGHLRGLLLSYGEPGLSGPGRDQPAS